MMIRAKHWIAVPVVFVHISVSVYKYIRVSVDQYISVSVYQCISVSVNLELKDVGRFKDHVRVIIISMMLCVVY